MSIRILGIDPGSNVTGFAVLENHGREFKAVCCDVIRLTDVTDPLDRLKNLYLEFTNLIKNYNPDICAIETPVYGKDPLAMMKLGRAQAAIIMSVLHQSVPLYEYYPKAVKKAISGNGNASKSQVAYMLRKLIVLDDENLPADATDALAVAWCHFQKIGNTGRVTDPGTSPPKSNRRNTWRSYIDNNPDRVRNT